MRDAPRYRRSSLRRSRATALPLRSLGAADLVSPVRVGVELSRGRADSQKRFARDERRVRQPCNEQLVCSFRLFKPNRVNAQSKEFPACGRFSLPRKIPADEATSVFGEALQRHTRAHLSASPSLESPASYRAPELSRTRPQNFSGPECASEPDAMACSSPPSRWR